MLPEAADRRARTAIAAGAVGGFVGSDARAARVQRRSERGRARSRAGERAPRFAGAIVADGRHRGVRADLRRTGRSARPLALARRSQRRAAGARSQATRPLDPPRRARTSNFAERDRLAGGRERGQRLAASGVGPGAYRTTEPIPVHGSWKAMVRVHTRRARSWALPIYLPRDRGDPGARGAGRAELHPRVRARRGDPAARAARTTWPGRTDRLWPISSCATITAGLGGADGLGAGAPRGVREPRAEPARERQEFGRVSRIDGDTHEVIA